MPCPRLPSAARRVRRSLTHFASPRGEKSRLAAIASLDHFRYGLIAAMISCAQLGPNGAARPGKLCHNGIAVEIFLNCPPIFPQN